MKDLQTKIADYNRFGQVLLALSTILMLGLLVPNGEKVWSQFIAMITAVGGFLGLSFFFFFRAKQVRERIDELEENE
ncbi:YrhC family protein [Ectobacillus polymachus]|uniref:YrhC family protein n=1 Tax=Ectobacillus polymachus TaxID=1508806 RepID=UPI003A83C770